jgi:hypothetical protein
MDDARECLLWVIFDRGEVVSRSIYVGYALKAGVKSDPWHAFAG